jgi:hypothetical protein
MFMAKDSLGADRQLSSVVKYLREWFVAEEYQREKA